MIKAFCIFTVCVLALVVSVRILSGSDDSAPSDKQQSNAATLSNQSAPAPLNPAVSGVDSSARGSMEWQVEEEFSVDDVVSIIETPEDFNGQMTGKELPVPQEDLDRLAERPGLPKDLQEQLNAKQQPIPEDLLEQLKKQPELLDGR